MKPLPNYKKGKSKKQDNELLISIDTTLKRNESLAIVNISVFVLLTFELIFLAMIQFLGYSQIGIIVYGFHIPNWALALLSLIVSTAIGRFTFSYLKNYYKTR
jgi:hypothetical protein